MNAHGQPLPASEAPLHRLEGKRIEEARLTRIDEHGDEVEVTLYLDDGSVVRFVAEEQLMGEDEAEAMPPTEIVCAYLAVEVVG